jgi:hypothetical protein
MDKVRFEEAVEMYKKGDKKGAEKLLTQLSCESEDAEVWYGLSRCADNEEKRIFYLEKCLAVQPDLLNARKELETLLGKQAEKDVARNVSSAAAPAAGSAAIPQKSTPLKKQDKVHSKAHLSPHWLYGPAVLLLLGLIIWQFIRIDNIEKSMVLVKQNTTTLQSEVNSIDGNILMLASSIDSIDGNISVLASSIDNTNGRISALASHLDRVASLAENGNQYAHSHSYSDARLKTNITEIKDPLSKVLLLRGVYYQWNLMDYSDLGFTDKLQVGVIAQDVEQVFPELVTTDQNGYRQVDYDRLSAILIEAIKEQQKEIDALKDQLK